MITNGGDKGRHERMYQMYSDYALTWYYCHQILYFNHYIISLCLRARNILYKTITIRKPFPTRCQ